MKHSYFLSALLLMLMFTTRVSAQQVDEQRMDSLAFTLMNQGDYEKSCQIRTREIELLSKSRPESDSVLISKYIHRSMCLMKIMKPADGKKDAYKAMVLWGKYHSDKDATFGVILHNLSLCQYDLHEYDSAMINARKALKIYEKIQKNDKNIMGILSHAAECFAAGNKLKEAINYELRSLNIYRDLYGDDTSNYLEELAYLQAYYEKAGEKGKAAAIALKRVQQPADFNIPEPVQFDSPESSHLANDKALYCCKYYLSHKLTAPRMMEAALFIEYWNEQSKDARVYLGQKEHDIYQSGSGVFSYVAYEASTILQQFESGNLDLTESHYKKAIREAVRFYVENREKTGVNENLEPLAKFYVAKDETKLNAEIGKWYKELYEVFEKMK